MDADLRSISGVIPAGPDVEATCALCQRHISYHHEATNLESLAMCGDCKFLFLEDSRPPTQEFRRMRTRTMRVRRTMRYNSSESIESIFSQQFSDIIYLAGRNQPFVSDQETRSLDSRTTPNRSRRWRRVLSDTESEGFDSNYSENESVIGFNGHRIFSDNVSYTSYGGDSDASIDGHSSFVNNPVFAHRDVFSDFDSDTDIDPMGAGMNEWNSDEQEDYEVEEENGDDDEWEEVEDDEESTPDSLVTRVQLGRSYAENGSSAPVNWLGQILFPEMETRLRTRESRLNLFAGSNGTDLAPSIGNSGDYDNGGGFDRLLDRLAESESMQRGACPAALSFVNSLPQLVINEEQEKKEGMACAICKDSFALGTVVNQLPCMHLYHPSCILPWIRTRNTCPLCRYELPTDNKDYESYSSRVLEIQEIRQHQDENEDNSSEFSIDVEAHNTESREERERGRGRGRWFFLAAPVVSLMGMALALWLGNSRNERRAPDLCAQGEQAIQGLVCRQNRRRRWSLF